MGERKLRVLAKWGDPRRSPQDAGFLRGGTLRDPGLLCGEVGVGVAQTCWTSPGLWNPLSPGPDRPESGLPVPSPRCGCRMILKLLRPQGLSPEGLSRLAGRLGEGLGGSGFACWVGQEASTCDAD